MHENLLVPKKASGRELLLEQPGADLVVVGASNDPPGHAQPKENSSRGVEPHDVEDRGQQAHDDEMVPPIQPRGKAPGSWRV